MILGNLTKIKLIKKLGSTKGAVYEKNKSRAIDTSAALFEGKDMSRREKENTKKHCGINRFCSQ